MMEPIKTINLIIVCAAIVLVIAGLIVGLSLEAERNHRDGGFHLGAPVVVCVKGSP